MWLEIDTHIHEQHDDFSLNKFIYRHTKRLYRLILFIRRCVWIIYLTQIFIE